MLSFKLVLSFIVLNILDSLSNKCLAMSFTAQYVGLNNRHKASTPLPLEMSALNIIEGITAAASIQINQPKPKHIEKLQTVLSNITIYSTSIRLKWKFLVKTKARIKRSGIASVEPERRSLEWVVKVRQYGTLNVNVYHVRDDNNSIDDILVHNQTYNYTIKGLQPLTAYELCIHSNHAISDRLDTIVNSYQRNLDICKEIVTHSSLDITDITMASAISSASTTVIIVVMFCCCRRGGSEQGVSERSKSINRGNKNRRKNFKYQRIWRWLDKSPQRSYPSSTTMSATNSRAQVNRPILNPVVNSQEFYINPQDIRCITGKNVRVFTKKSKPLLNYTTNNVPKVRNNITTTSMFRKRYARPNSWPLIDTERTWLKTQSDPSISTNPRTNKLWFHSLSSEVNVNTIEANEAFV